MTMLFKIFSGLSLRYRILLPLIGSITVLLIIAALFFHQMTSNELSKIQQGKVEALASFLKQSSKTYILNYDLSALEDFVDVGMKDADIDHIEFIDGSGIPYTETKPKAVNYAVKNYSDEILMEDGTLLGVLNITYNEENSTAALQQNLKVILACFFSIIALLCIIIYLVALRLSKPLIAITQDLTLVSDDALDNSRLVLKGAESLADGVEKQRAALDSNVSAISEITEMVKQTNQNVLGCLDVSKGTLELSNEGSKNMGKLAHSVVLIENSNKHLQEINDIIQKISDYTKVIHDIVFQTKLLSLNASIEAERAGEHGRGFAVVAQEVGQLALTSGQASQDIDKLLKDSMVTVGEIVKETELRVKESKALSEQTQVSFSGISKQIQGLSKEIDSFSEAFNQQMKGIVQVNSAMESMAGIVNSNHHIANETSQVSMSYKEQSLKLKQVTDTMKGLIRGKKAAN
ncbi:methyl-accepting chemotaxis protein [Enterovibrio sp. ZSDZ42]|uniref:Methyl-accepting chemotaxis protein n=1 Tax=Enterovibrio gelatinilyticus TaxID=2899819 RepID=A0ABT5QZ26_9GAMM|nr:methyl-accepting chemotaxis protein [Enterovibrio sp. ZSDZ42]MDD1793267.1 methyl-accepting chemotaxis protein [Enterovibrio sp. ZSDZ42]